MAKQNRSLSQEEEVIVVSNGPDVTSADFESTSRRVNSDVTIKDIARKKLGNVYDKQEKVTVMVAPMYGPYFGRSMHASINGVSISVPCDGRPYFVPKSFAMQIQGRLQAVNEQHAKQARFSDIGRNNESSPGELALY